jgi:hypothetical protein
MAAPTLNQTEFTNLWQRVNAIDGVNLDASVTGSVAALQKQINGLQTTIEQVTLTLEATLMSLNTQVVAIKAMLASLTGNS